MTEFPQIFLTIEGLDECRQPRKSQSELMLVLQSMALWQLSGLHLLTTSRDEGPIRKSLSTLLSKEDMLISSTSEQSNSYTRMK